MKKVLAVVMVLGLAVGVAQAQLIFNTMGQTISEDFDGQTSGNLPANWSIISETSTAWPNWQSDGETGTAGGVRYNDFEGTRYLGMLGNGTLDANQTWDVTLHAQFENQTGGTITQLDLSYSVLQFRQALTRESALGFFYSLDGTTWNEVEDMRFSTASDPAVTTGSATGYDPVGGSFEGSVNGLSILDNATFYVGVRYDGTFTEGSEGGSRQGLGFSDVEVTVIPEPGTIGLLALGLLGVLVARRRMNR